MSTKTNSSQHLGLRKGVRLQSISVEHADNMYRWMCDPEVSRNIGLRNEPSPERTRVWIDQAQRDPSKSAFAILWNDQHIGNVILDRIDSYLSSARLSIYIGEPSARRQGIGQTAIYQALIEGFKKLNLHKIWLTVHTENLSAIHLYEKLGFVQEGILRDEFLCEGKRADVLYMGMLRHEFKIFNPSE